MTDAAGWLQTDIALDRTTADAATNAHRLFAVLVPVIDDLTGRGLATGWFFQRKPPDIRLRVGVPAPAAPDGLHEITEQLGGATLAETGRTITMARWSAYEPETDRFGGSEAMVVAHRHFVRNALLWHQADHALRHTERDLDGDRGHDPGRHQHRLTMLGLLAAREIVETPGVPTDARTGVRLALHRITEGAPSPDPDRTILGPSDLPDVATSAAGWLGASHAAITAMMRSAAGDLALDLARSRDGSPLPDPANLLALILHFDANRWGIDGAAQRWIADCLDPPRPGT